VVLGDVLHQDALVHLGGELVAALVTLDHPRRPLMLTRQLTTLAATPRAPRPPAAANALPRRRRQTPGVEEGGFVVETVGHQGQTEGVLGLQSVLYT
jgi:hypothetical protein